MPPYTLLRAGDIRRGVLGCSSVPTVTPRTLYHGHGSGVLKITFQGFHNNTCYKIRGYHCLTVRYYANTQGLRWLLSASSAFCGGRTRCYRFRTIFSGNLEEMFLNRTGNIVVVNHRYWSK